MDWIVVIVVIFFTFLIFSWWNWNNKNLHTEKDKRKEKLSLKITTIRRKIEGIEIKKQELLNQIEELNYEIEDDLTKTWSNDLKIRKINLQVENINDKLLQLKWTLMDLEQQFNSIN